MVEEEPEARALRENEERFRALAEAAREAILINENGIIVEVNSAFIRELGYSREELLGRNGPEFLVAPESRPAVEASIRSGGHGGTGEIAFLTKSGERRFFVSKVDQRHLGHRPPFDPLAHRQAGVAPERGVLPGLQRGGGGAEQHGDGFELRAHHGNVSGVVARGGLLLERSFMFLVDHDQAELPRRREDRAARTCDRLRLREAHVRAADDGA